jgi:hypothetical protein
MQDDSGSVVPTIRGIIDIIVPPLGTAYPTNANCTIDAKGAVDEYLATQLHAVEARLNGGAWKSGTVSSFDWEVTGLGRAGTVYLNKLEVRAEITANGVRFWTDIETRFFTASGNYACDAYGYGYGYFVGQAHAKGLHPAAPIKATLPRYYRLIALAQREQTGPDCGLHAGGLWQRSAVYLAYNAALSNAYEAVWQDINLPESVGRWTLRVWSSCGGHAELSFLRLTTTEVPPPLVLHCDKWNPRGCNLLPCDRLPGMESEPIVLQVEPA